MSFFRPLPTKSLQSNPPSEDLFPMPVRVAFQPILRCDGSVFAQESLVRGPHGEGAAYVLDRVTKHNRSAFDQLCRTTAIETAARLSLCGCLLTINFDRNATNSAMQCLRNTMTTADRAGMICRDIVFEVVEDVRPAEPGKLRRIIRAYHEMGFLIALDDFGTAHSNFDQLLELQPDIVKADIRLVRGINQDPWRQATMRCLVQLCADLGVTLIAEGVETADEFSTLEELGVTLFQGFFLAPPALEAFAHPQMLPVCAERHPA